MKSKEVALKLANAQSEKEVTDLLNSSFFENGSWRPIGNQRNESMVSAQAPDPVRALIEKLTNSIDAMLILECRKQYGKPSELPYRTFSEATYDLGINIETLSESEIGKFAGDIQLIADGTKDKINFTVVDNGEGQKPEDFNTTFVSMQQGNKIDMPFVQGIHGMGGHAVLRYCDYQLILSKKSPFLSKNSKWGWTVTKKHYLQSKPDGSYDYRQPWYEYFTVDGVNVPSFEAGEISIGELVMSYGSLVKMYNYRLANRQQRTYIHWNLRQDIERLFYKPALPIRIVDRPMKNRGRDTGRILGNFIRFKSEGWLESGFPYIKHFNAGILGNVTVEVYVFKDRKQEKNPKKSRPVPYTTKSECVFFTLNGQVRDTLGKNFIKNKLDLTHIAEHLAIVIDCSNIDPNNMGYVFSTARDKILDSPEIREAKEIIKKEIKEIQRLKELNEERRKTKIVEHVAEDKDIDKHIDEMIKELKRRPMFPEGNKIRGLRGKEEQTTFIGSYIPTYLEIHKYKKDKPFIKQVPQNRYCLMKFDTDAQNDYLNRLEDYGEAYLQILSASSHQYKDNSIATKSIGLTDGILSFKIEPENCEVGDILDVEAVLTRPLETPLTKRFRLKIEKKAESDNKPSGDRPHKTSKMQRPPWILIDNSDEDHHWDRLEPYLDRPWGKDDNAVAVKENGQPHVFINMVSEYLEKLRHEFSNYPELVETSWKFFYYYDALDYYWTLDSIIENFRSSKSGNGEGIDEGVDPEELEEYRNTFNNIHCKSGKVIKWFIQKMIE